MNRAHDLDHLDPDQDCRKVVLYVEDHPVNVMLMQALIDRLTDLELVVAQDGREALCLAADLQPALILLDLRLPDCRGSELLPLLRRLPGCSSAPAVAVTAEDNFDIQGTGFGELWTKPIDVPWVLQRLGVLTASQPGTPLPARRFGNVDLAPVRDRAVAVDRAAAW